MTIGRFTVMSIHTYTRRYALFLTGVILSATGIAFITRAGLGTSPVSGLPFVLSLITSISMGHYQIRQRPECSGRSHCLTEPSWM